MKGAKQHNKRELMTIRRTIESVFSVLKYYGIENILARSIDGFQQTVEIIVLTYNISLHPPSLSKPTRPMKYLT